MLDYLESLRTFSKHDVDFILVGSLSAALQGSPLIPLDMDVLHSRRSENLPRLVQALRELDAEYRTPGDKEPLPDESHLSSTSHHFLNTKYGDLAVLGAIGDSQTYEDLASHARSLEIEPGLLIKTLSLEKYVEIKEQLNGDNDKAALPTLRATLQEKRKLEQRKTPSGPPH
jgi:hypothetical protein